jgi:flagellar biosynthesis protein
MVINMKPYEKGKEKPKRAIALAYDPDDEAPRIIAGGQGELAERIIERAKDADIPIHKDNMLADTLSRLEIGDMIPPELYEVVAEILVFVDAMDKIKGKMDKDRSR